jgi:carnitine O-acetyltransferase
MDEHSTVDALVPSIACEYAVVDGSDAGMFANGGVGVGDSGEDGGNGWEKLEWVVDERIKRECRRAEEDARALIADSDDNGLWFNEYGADWIKDVGMFPYLL